MPGRSSSAASMIAISDGWLDELTGTRPSTLVTSTSSR